MFRSKKTNTEFLPIGDIKDWRDAGYEIEALGNRLDAARKAAKESTTRWARDFWQTTYDRLFTRWQLMIQLKDTGLKQKGGSSGPTIDYDWWERSEEVKIIGFTWFDHYFENTGLQGRLDESWERARELKVQKARQGQA